jgi:hypothetical protein
MALVLIAAALIALAAVGLNRRGDDRSTTATSRDRMATGAPAPSGTSGQREADTDNSGPALATIGGLESILGAGNGSDLLGRRLQVRVPIHQHINDVAFWVGSGDDALLVVLTRDTRNGVERAHGDPGDVRPVGDVITGTIERLPHAEAMFSWGLTNADVARLNERPVYLRAVPAAG